MARTWKVAVAAPHNSLQYCFWVYDVLLLNVTRHCCIYLTKLFKVSTVYILFVSATLTSQWCFSPLTFFDNIRLNSLSWTALVLGLHSQLKCSAGCLGYCEWLFLRCWYFDNNYWYNLLLKHFSCSYFFFRKLILVDWSTLYFNFPCRRDPNSF